MRLSLKSGSMLALSNLAEMTFPFIRNIVLARLLAPHEFGVAISLAMISALVEIGFDFGVPVSAVRYTATDDPKRALATLHTLQLSRAALVGTLIMAMAPLLAIIFSSPELIDDAFRQQGLGGFDGEVGATPLVLIVSHVVLYLVAAGLSILLLVKKKIAFYIPLIAGVVAAVIFWAALIMLMLSDPDFAATYGR